jgi:SAM-dependent methyltransferase
VNDDFHYQADDLDAMAGAVNYTRWILSRFQPYLCGRVCEVGAGMGALSGHILDEPGVTGLTICEPSANLHARLVERFAADQRVVVHHSVLAQAMTDSPGFDAVIYDNVLEHIEDDAAGVATVVEALNPGGHLLVLVPALSWLYSDFDARIGHHRRYHRPQLRSLLDGAGLEVVDLRYMDMPGVLPWYVSMVLMKGGLNPGAVKLYDRVGIPVARALESLLPPPFGKNLLAVARKPGT